MTVNLAAAEAVVMSTLSLSEGALAEFSSPTVMIIQRVLDALTSVVPIVVQYFPSLLTSVRNVLDLVGQSGNATPEQMATQETLNAQCDAAYEAAAKAAGLRS